VATWSLLLDICHRKNLILKGTLLFQMIPATRLLTPLLVRNLYKDLVEKFFFFSRAHYTQSALLSVKAQSFNICRRPSQLS
jgi:hypothetical protein